MLQLRPAGLSCWRSACPRLAAAAEFSVLHLQSFRLWCKARCCVAAIISKPDGPWETFAAFARTDLRELP